MSNQTSQRVAEVVWPWRTPPQTGDTAAGRRRRTLIQCAVMWAIALVLMLVGRKHVWMGAFVLGLSVVVFVGGFWVPPIYAAFDRFGRLLAKWVGAATTWLLLVPFFYLCFVPMRLFLVLSGKDPMHRRWERERASYWTDRPPVPGPQHYTRQY